MDDRDVDHRADRVVIPRIRFYQSRRGIVRGEKITGHLSFRIRDWDKEHLRELVEFFDRIMFRNFDDYDRRNLTLEYDASKVSLDLELELLIFDQSHILFDASVTCD
ncbi:uncharacterized protein LOC102679002 [Apis dorsata]|uniref:uncharacterized protein LOC102679002 n=1 Tax=Apis dorsata TaxID=7462 RepID=UPI0003DF6317|nr:uncharacterized protein LOC102679002 [Apis dorsata]